MRLRLTVGMAACLIMPISGAHELDLKRLPLGDGKLASSPRIGYVWPCSSGRAGVGAHARGSWIRNDGTFDFTAKAIVDGNVQWPSRFQIRALAEQKQRQIVGNALPKHGTGHFPIAQDDDAYAFDRNPNAIREQDVLVRLPMYPTRAPESSCLPMGPIGFLLSGAYLYGALDEAGRDAVAHEVQDRCQGHPEQRGRYHYHSLSNCVEDRGKSHSPLVGYALDGFGIYGHRGEKGKILRNADLDECHGHAHEIDWDGKRVSMYHYHSTWEFPYTLGCFRGPPVLRDPSRPPPRNPFAAPARYEPKQRDVSSLSAYRKEASAP